MALWQRTEPKPFSPPRRVSKGGTSLLPRNSATRRACKNARVEKDPPHGEGRRRRESRHPSRLRTWIPIRFQWKAEARAALLIHKSDTLRVAHIREENYRFVCSFHCFTDLGRKSRGFSNINWFPSISRGKRRTRKRLIQYGKLVSSSKFPAGFQARETSRRDDRRRVTRTNVTLLIAKCA